jgi:undecaprenyl-diphosphatase
LLSPEDYTVGSLPVSREPLAQQHEIRYFVRVLLRAERIAVLTFLGAVTLVLTLRWWLSVDESVYQWIQYHRSCRVAACARSIGAIVQLVLMFLIGIGLMHRGSRPPWWALGLLVLLVAGGGGVELLKTGIERLRPNSTPAMVSGDSFPSGHTTGATMAAMIAMTLAHDRDWPRWARWSVYFVAVTCIVAQAAGRLLNGSHWLSDIIASILLGVAWVLGAGWVRRLPRVVMASVLGVACVAFLVFDDVPEVRLRLPSALDVTGSSLASVEFGTAEARSALIGAWKEGPAEPIGPVSWASSSDVGVVLRLRANDRVAGVLKVTLRPATGSDNQRRCVRVAISVNGWVAHEIALLRGWREYHLDLPPGVIRLGDNTVRFRIVADSREDDKGGEGGLVAFRYLKLFPQV